LYRSFARRGNGNSSSRLVVCAAQPGVACGRSRRSLGPLACFAERQDVMPKNEEAPPVIDSSLVRAFAPVQPDVAFTGKQCVIVGGVEAGPGSRVVVAFNQRSGAYLLLLCNDSWESFAAAAFTTIEEALREAELWYDGISKYWVLTNYSVEEDRQHLEA